MILESAPAIRKSLTTQKFVLREDPDASADLEVDEYYGGLNEKLYAALPSAARILELGCAAGRLGERYKQLHPEVYWVGVDLNDQALRLAATRLDATHRLDVDAGDLSVVGADFDCVVFGNLLEHLKCPETLLNALQKVTTPEATLVCCIPNMGHISVIERFLMGDISYEREGLLDATHLRFFSHRSLFKMLLDTGWLPDLCDSDVVDAANPALLENLFAGAAAVGVPVRVMASHLLTYQVIVRCKKRAGLAKSVFAEPLSVIVAVTNEEQARLNILRSPGLKELEAEIIFIRDAGCAADAFRSGAESASNCWRLFCHQDVYFPRGSGFAISKLLEDVLPNEVESTVLGFAGIALDGERTRYAGLLIDRTHLFDHQQTDRAISLDEFCVALHRNCEYAIDPQLGWHLWATDLCLQSVHRRTGSKFARCVRVPLFHNSTNDGVLPASYHESGARLLAKYPHLAGVTTLCGRILRQTSGIGTL